MSASPKRPSHPWEFRPRFRARAFGWKSQAAIKRVKEAVAEIKKVARMDGVLAAEGAVMFLERVSPALEQVDSSSGAIGNAVNGAVEALVDIIASAAVPKKTRQNWLERLFEAHGADQIPYIEVLAEHWGPLCASQDMASHWAEHLMEPTRNALSPKQVPRALFHGTTACLSSLHTAGRYDELLELLESESFWPYKRWAALALDSKGEYQAAIDLAESSRSPWANDLDIDRLCENVLLSSGSVEEAYDRYGLRANWASTYTTWFRRVLKRYPNKDPKEVLQDLVAETPGEEGKWFAAAKDAKLLEVAAALANQSPCSPQTLTRAARDFKQKQPEFAIEAGLAALRWLSEGFGYDVTALDVRDAYKHTMDAATEANRGDLVKERIRTLVSEHARSGTFVASALARELADS